MASGAGLLGSLCMCFIKGITESFKAEGLYGYSLYIYILIALFIAIFQLKFLNKAMENYDQVETIPIYQSSLILLNIASGAIIMNEKRLYTWFELFRIIMCGLISIIGVWMIIKKPGKKAKKCKCDSIKINKDKKDPQDQIDINNFVQMIKKIIKHKKASNFDEI